MTANEKRARDLCAMLGRNDEDVASITTQVNIAAHLDAAERRGEERVLRWMDRVRASAWIGGAHRPVVSEYRKARRARVGRGRK